MKRLITIILCMILTISCTGCSGSQTQSGSSAASGNTSGANSGSPQSGTNVDSTSSGAVMNPTAEGFVYVPKYMSANLDSVSNAYNYHTASFLGDSMYFSAVSFDMESPISSAGYQIKKMDLNTGETTLIGEPVYNGRSVQMLAVSDSGSIVLMTDFNGNASNLTVLDADGNDITPSGLTLALSTLTKSWSSLYMKDLEVDNDGNMYVLTSGAALEDRTCEKLLNWIDCDVECYYPDGFGRTEDGRISVLNFTIDVEPEVILLTKIPASEVPQKTTLVYAVLQLDMETKKDVVAFNKSNSQYRITVKEYGNGDVETGRIELNNPSTARFRTGHF